MKFLSLAVLLLCFHDAIAFSNLRVTSGVYSGLTIVLRESVPPKNCPQYLDNVERVVNEFSRDLYALTRLQGWVRSASVVLPRSWDVTLCQPGRRIRRLGENGVKAQPALNRADLSIGNEQLSYILSPK